MTGKDVRRRWLLVAFVALGQFMVLLDATVVNLALPSIQRGLHASGSQVEWVLNAYVLCFGGLMLLGGRAADQWGRRRTMLAGVAAFALASLACGLAPGGAALIPARALQGCTAALLTPSALSLVTTSVATRKERNLALSIWSALSGLGATLGLVIGGFITESLSWRWIFYINVPVGAIVLAGTLALAAPDRPAGRTGRPDFPGALLVTAGLSMIVLATINVQGDGWGSVAVLAPLAAGLAGLVGFITLESRTGDPLVPLRLFRTRSMISSSIGRVLTAGVQSAAMVLVSYYLQRTLLYSPLQAGMAFLPLGVTAVAITVVIPGIMRRLGPGNLYLAGAVGSAAAMAWLAWGRAGGSYAPFILPVLLVFGVSMQATTVPVNVAGIGDLPPERHGLGSGVLNASFQVGFALGVAVAATAALTGVQHGLAAGDAAALAWPAGLRAGFAAATVIAVLNVINAAFGFPRRPARGTAATEVGAQADREAVTGAD